MTIAARRLLDQYLLTHRFTRGAPRDFTVSPDGARVLFLRSRGGRDPAACLWEMCVPTGEERLLADPGGGVDGYATDHAARLVAFAAGGRVGVARSGAAGYATLDLPAPAADPCPAPDGTHLAYVHDAALRLVRADGTGDRPLAVPESAHVTYGLAERVAVESMDRRRGFWWSPDSTRLLVARADTARVSRWYLADPCDPAAPPRSIAYPAAGAANADVSLWLMRPDAEPVAVRWDPVLDPGDVEYVAAVSWTHREPLVSVQDRTQRRLHVLSVDPDTGQARLRHRITSPFWVPLVPGVPALSGSGRLLTVEDRDGTHRLCVDGEAVTADGLQVRAVTAVTGEQVLFRASTDPATTHVWRWSPSAGAVPETHAPGVWHAVAGGDTTLVLGRTRYRGGRTVTVHHPGGSRCVRDLAERPLRATGVRFLTVGERALRVAVLLPSDPAVREYPVVMNPYGGPAGQRVVEDHDSYVFQRWLAEQGFAVVIVDGRGTPGRGPAWEHAIRGDLAGPVLTDQVDGLHGAAAALGCLDLRRVGILGWSFGGFVAAHAVLCRPDVFHAAVAGAPVTDQRLYQSHWRERHLGHPDEEPDGYCRSSLTTKADRLARPLMLVHGTADENVVSAHTSRLSAALLRAGRPHHVLPVPGAGHVPADPVLHGNALELSVRFLQDALCRPERPARIPVPEGGCTCTGR